METLAYLHLSLAYENPTDVPLGEQLDWRKFTIQSWMYLLPVIVALGLLGTANEVLAETLRQGAQGSQVTFIQERLRQLGYFNQAPTGTFGSATKAAVIKFQRDRGLPADGIVGPKTETALFDEFDQKRRERRVSSQELTYRSSTDVVLRRGDRGSDVTALQQRLAEEGFYFGSIDGYFGSETQAAVRQLQLEKGLEADGIAGSRTFAALDSRDGTYSKRPRNRDRNEITLQSGSSGSRVEELQQKLKSADFYTGPIDGYYGFETTQAVTQLQLENNLAVTGIADRKTLAALQAYRYMVVVPNAEDARFKVRQAGFNALIADSRLGDYVKAGTFNNRARAESRSYLLRSRGLDARVVYFR